MAEQKDLFTRLKKMFSTDVIVRAVGGKNLKIIDTDEGFDNQEMANKIEQLFNEELSIYHHKSLKWDELHNKIAKCYFDDNGDEIDDDEADLITIGEISAEAFGFL